MIRQKIQITDYVTISDVKIPVPRGAEPDRRKPRAFYGKTTNLPLEIFAAELFVENELRAEQGVAKPLTDDQLKAIIDTEFVTPDGATPRVLIASLRNSYNHGQIERYKSPVYVSLRYLHSGQAAAKGPSQTATATGQDLLDRSKKYDICDPRADRWAANSTAPYPLPTESRSPKRSRRTPKAN